MVFSVVLQRQLFMFLLIRGFFAEQMDHFCKAKGLKLESKTTTVVGQKDSFCKKMKLFVSCDDCAFWQHSSQPIVYQQYITNRSKLTNFAPKISLCVQLVVLSDGKCKYCHGAALQSER